MQLQLQQFRTMKLQLGFHGFFVPIKGAGTKSRDSTLGACARAALDEVTWITLSCESSQMLLSCLPARAGLGRARLLFYDIFALLFERRLS